MKTQIINFLKSPFSLLFVFFIFFIYWFSFLISSDPWPSSDLPSQVLTIEQYRNYWYKGLITFYDPTTFTGWPVHHFYGFLPFFITAPISYLFDLFSSEPVTLAIHTLIVLVSSALIFSIYFAAKPFYEELLESLDNNELAKKRTTLDILFALVLGLLCFWFLNSDYQDWSVGIGSPVLTGLYGQMFGWHCLLIYFGFLTRQLKDDKKSYFPHLAIAVCMLFFCHTLTAVYAMSLGGLSFLWFNGKRIEIFKSHIFGILLCGMMLFPFLYYMSEYTVTVPINPQDFLGVILRYPLHNLLESLKSTILGRHVLINYTYIFVAALILTSFVSSKIRRTKIFSGFLVITVLLIVLFTSKYFMRSIPIGLHYYRFAGPTMLLVLVLSSIAFLVWFDFLIKRNKKYFKMSSVLFVVIITICFCFNMIIPHDDLYQIKNQKELIQEQYDELEKVYEYFKKENSKGRVYVENLHNYGKFPPFLSHHYLTSYLYENTGYEAVVGVQQLETMSYRYITNTLVQLDARTYSPGNINRGLNLDLEDDNLIDQLKLFGITHIVAGREEFIAKISKFSIEDPVDVNNYKIIKISETPFRKVAENTKEIIGFVDLKGNTPFSLVDHYFYVTKYLYNNFNLIKLHSVGEKPDYVKTIIVNGDGKELIKLKEKFKNINFINLDYIDESFDVNHYRPVRASSNPELYQYRYLAGYLENTFDIQEKLKENYKDKEKKNIATKIKDNSKPEFQWNKNFQSFSLSNLIPGETYTINYSYFPYWHTDDGELYRGSGERMIFIPKKSSANFKYTRVYSLPNWLGWFSTIFTLFFIVWYSRRLKKHKL